MAGLVPAIHVFLGGARCLPITDVTAIDVNRLAIQFDRAAGDARGGWVCGEGV